MPYYVLNPDIVVRSWDGVPFACCNRRTAEIIPLSKDTFSAALFCDGEHDIPRDEAIERLLEASLIRECEKGEVCLADWQRLRFIENRVTPHINLEITQRCNCNCLHCFNAEGNAMPKEELSFEQIDALLDDAADCGVLTVLLTGGEPLLHPDFLRIVDAVYDKGMSVFEINTNGYFITREILEHFREKNIAPCMKISFDGIGFHDTMRGKAGMEQHALNAIRLCVEYGMDVMVQMNVNRLNLETILPSLEMLDSMGVNTTRMIRTTEAPRWAESNRDNTLSWEEYFDTMLKTCAEYIRQERRMKLIAWLFLTVYPQHKCYNISAVRYTKKDFSMSFPLCKCVRSMPAIGANGNIYPCMQMSGYFEMNGVRLGNVLTGGLSGYLRDGSYHDIVYTTICEKIEKNEKCRTCPYLTYCGTGCPALSLLYTGSFDGVNPIMCTFYENGWYQKIKDALPDLKNLSEIDL